MFSETYKNYPQMLRKKKLLIKKVNIPKRHELTDFKFGERDGILHMAFST